jgi:putative membrane protein
MSSRFWTTSFSGSMEYTDLPTLNAILNSASGVLVISGLYFINRKNVAAHKACMLAALGVSALFLTSYLIYHYQVGSIRFEREGLIRAVYLSILITHVVLAVVIVPLVLRTAYLALKNRLDAHRRIARWTYPIWIYVSVTGVVVYLMLYQL